MKQAAMEKRSEFERVDMPCRRLEITSDGRVEIPADMRAAMLAESAGPLLAEIVDGELHLITPQAALRKVRRMIAENDWGPGSVLDQLEEERHAEALREKAEALLPAHEW